MSPKKPEAANWLTPKALSLQLGIMALVGAFMLWAGGTLYVKRSDYDVDRYNASSSLTAMAKDLEYIKAALQRLEDHTARPLHR